MFNFIFQDFKFNNNIKSKFILLSSRFCQLMIKNKFLLFICFFILLFYIIITKWIIRKELNWSNVKNTPSNVVVVRNLTKIIETDIIMSNYV